MGSQVTNEYAPDVVSPPGDTLQETLDALGMPQAKLAERMGRTPKLINEIVKGKAAITPETALQLERVFGVPARFWNNRERHYREHLARIEERERLQQYTHWLAKVPDQVMCQRGWIQCWQDPVDRVREVLSFFGVVSPDQIQGLWLSPDAAAFRQSPAFEANPWSVAAWLRRGEIEALELPCAPYDAMRFKSVLKEIRALTLEPPEVFQSELVRLCAGCGVAVVFVPELPKIRASGATRWLMKDKAMIQLSLRYRTDDHLWFTFFHEAGHIVLHGKRDIFVETGGGKDKDEKEREADQFAANVLIPRSAWRQIAGQPRYSKDMIRAYARELGIAPGIIVGRLQYEKYLPYSHCNDLKRGLVWAHEVEN